MGPTNVALVKLFRADQALREAQARLHAAARNVRVQERKVAELAEKLKLAQSKLKEQQALAGQLDLDLKTRDAHIEKLRTQQQTAKNNKEYQAFLVEINTAKVDRNKVEDETLRVLEVVERGQNEVGAMQLQLDAEQKKLAQLEAESGETVSQLTADVEALRPARESAAGAVPPRPRDAFERLAERYEGEALSPIAKPDRRREEYVCSACNMSLVADVYNKLHSRDDLVVCPSCGRLLYIPEDLPPEAAINSRGSTASRRSAKSSAAGGSGGGSQAAEKPVVIEPRAKGRWGELLNAAQGESVKAAIDAGNDPVSLQVMINGELAGFYKGKTREHLERVIRFRMQEEGVEGEANVSEGSPGTAEPSPEAVEPQSSN
ncbi:MAG TPA: C4-type zinc ribbon domain-containing protein [Tepidisphaeraceae bacterium]|jgi:predicted  nucleic acid-binding Zn-ribbon protein|nr:C4-type zinc ribbon domain-containing protein [Tepidisphaeraceae bacterium]